MGKSAESVNTAHISRPRRIQLVILICIGIVTISPSRIFMNTVYINIDSGIAVMSAAPDAIALSARNISDSFPLVNEVDISNSERAAVANEADADAFIRIHANGSGNSGATGAMTICQTPGNVYNGDLYEESRALADSVLNAYTEKTGIDYEYVWETDTMSGINWCRVPVTILEMGYMTNSEEDLQMQDSGFQEKMTDGIADGIDAFMADRTPKEH